MALHLDHTIVPAHDKETSARFIAQVLGLEYKGLWGHFAQVEVNDILTLDFMDFPDGEHIESHHLAFIASDDEFDAILSRVKENGVTYGSRPYSQDGEINYLHQGRGVYFRDANGHSWEVITHTYI